jgi:hypothetical protein
MSHSFYINQVHDLKVQDVLANLPNPKFIFTDDQQPAENGDWPRGESYIYIDKVSVRPIEVSYDGKTIQARIFQASCHEDYQLALNFIKTIAKQHNQPIEPEDNNELSLEAFSQQYNDEWARQHLNTMLSMLISTFKAESGGEYRMMGTRRELKAGQNFMGQLFRDQDNFAEQFFDRFRLLQYFDKQDIFVASLIHLSNKEKTKFVSMAVYPNVPTILGGHPIIISLKNDKAADEENDTYNIAFDKFLELMGDRAVRVHEDILFLPKLTDSEWQDLLAQAKHHHLDDIYSIASDEPTSQGDADNTNQVTAEDLQTLAYGPYLVFFLVAAADGTIDEKEVKAFGKLLSGDVDEILKEIIVRTPLDPFETIREISTSGAEEVVHRLTNIRQLLEQKFPESVANAYKVALLRVGKKIAEASGGGFFGFGKKISEEEAAAVVVIAQLLGVDL